MSNEVKAESRAPKVTETIGSDGKLNVVIIEPDAPEVPQNIAYLVDPGQLVTTTPVTATPIGSTPVNHITVEFA